MSLHTLAPSPPGGDILLEIADGTPLPLDDWHLGHRVQPNGRAVIEISDDIGDLVGLISSTSLPMLSVDAAWRGKGHDADGTPRWWALAIGHASTDDDDEPVVTFLRRAATHLPAHRAVVQPRRTQGLWIAVTSGLYTAVSCRRGTDHTVRRLTVHSSRARA
jgi:hypothetical protein